MIHRDADEIVQDELRCLFEGSNILKDRVRELETLIEGTRDAQLAEKLAGITAKYNIDVEMKNNLDAITPVKPRPDVKRKMDEAATWGGSKVARQ